jgi:hypothetical protein
MIRLGDMPANQEVHHTEIKLGCASCNLQGEQHLYSAKDDDEVLQRHAAARVVQLVYRLQVTGAQHQ